MANEIQFRCWLAFAKGGSSASLDSLVVTLNLTGSRFIRNRQSVGTSEEALILGEVVPSSGLFICINRDATNFVQFKPATGGTVCAIANAGEAVLWRWPSTVTAPYVQANTAACEIEYLQLPA